MQVEPELEAGAGVVHAQSKVDRLFQPRPPALESDAGIVVAMLIISHLPQPDVRVALQLGVHFDEFGIGAEDQQAQLGIGNTLALGTVQQPVQL